MKKLLSVLLVLGMLLSLVTSASVATAQSSIPVALTLSSAQGKVGDVISIDISITEKSDVGALALEIPVPTQYLESATILDKRGNPVYFTAGEAVTDSGASVAVSDGCVALSDGGSGVKVALASVNGLWDAGKLVTVYFKILKTLPANGVSLECNVTEILPYEGEIDYAVTVIPGNITMADQPDVPKKPVTITIGSAEGSVGDVVAVDISVSEHSDIGALTLEIPVPTQYLESATILDERGNPVYFTAGEAVTDSGAVAVVSDGFILLSDGSTGMKTTLVTADGLWNGTAIGTIYFKLLKNLPASGIQLDCNVEQILHYEDVDINYDVTVVPGNITMADQSDVPQKPVTITIGSAEGSVGDVVAVDISVSEHTDIGALTLEIPVPTQYLESATIEDNRGRDVWYTAGAAMLEARATATVSEGCVKLSDGSVGVKVELATADGLWNAGKLVTIYFKVIKSLSVAGVKLDCNATEILPYDGQINYDVTVVPGYITTNGWEKIVVNLIDALPYNITLEHEGLVKTIRAAYEKLSDDEQAAVYNIDKLIRAENIIAQLKSAVLYGDVDQNGIVDSTDALELLKSVVGKTTLNNQQKRAAEVDGNGAVDSTDALEILKRVVGKIRRFPVEIA